MRTKLLATVAFAVAAFGTSFVSAHCEVPCGIYGDQRRFEEMLEDQATIAKAIDGVIEISQQEFSPKSINQAD
jgi:nickel superoxide dismutase